MTASGLCVQNYRRRQVRREWHSLLYQRLAQLASGLTTVTRLPGVRSSLLSKYVLFANASFPVWQNLPGIQNNECDRFSFGLGFDI